MPSPVSRRLLLVGAAAAPITAAAPDIRAAAAEPKPSLVPQFIVFTGAINNSTCGNIMLRAREAVSRNPNVTLVINSYGGTVGPGIALYLFLRNLPNLNLTTYALYAVESTAVLIFLAGNTRLAHPDAHFRSLRVLHLGLVRVGTINC